MLICQDLRRLSRWEPRGWQSITGPRGTSCRQHLPATSPTVKLEFHRSEGESHWFPPCLPCCCDQEGVSSAISRPTADTCWWRNILRLHRHVNVHIYTAEILKAHGGLSTVDLKGVVWKPESCSTDSWLKIPPLSQLFQWLVPVHASSLHVTFVQLLLYLHLLNSSGWAQLLPVNKLITDAAFLLAPTRCSGVFHLSHQVAVPGTRD